MTHTVLWSIVYGLIDIAKNTGTFFTDKKGDNVSDGSEFDQVTKPFTWISNRMTKMKLQGTTMKKLQVKYQSSTD